MQVRGSKNAAQNRTNRCMRFLFASLAAFAGVKTASAADASGAISDSTLRQIQSLSEQKRSRTPAQKKISSQLLYATTLSHGKNVADGVPKLTANVNAKSDGTVVVDIRAEADAAPAIAALGATILNVDADGRSIRANVSLDRLEDIAALDDVRFIRPDPKAMHNRVLTMRDAIVSPMRPSLTDALPNGYSGTGVANSEGVVTHQVFSARGTFNTTGAGVRIGVLSSGAPSSPTPQASGDLPPTCTGSTPANQSCMTVVHDNPNDDEGTAMMEIIHDVAPGAQLFFATGDGGTASFAANIRELRSTYHCDIIVDDISYFGESPFQDGQAAAIVSSTNGGLITQAVNDVVGDGALYFSSAANSGGLDAGTSGTYEGDFVDGGALTGLNGGTVHNFGGGQVFDVLTEGNGTDENSYPSYSLYWSDPLGGSSNDYDLYVFDSGGFVIAASTDTQDGTEDPYEAVAFNAHDYPNARFLIFKATGAADRFLHLGTNRGRLSIGTQGTTLGHNAASGAYGVAAAPAYSPAYLAPPPYYGPYPSAFSTSSVVEPFSSDGPRRIFFTGAGAAITAGNFSSTGGSVLQQPLITAADGVEVSGAGGFENPFFGTSAAAPHAAAIAALLRSAKPTLTAAQVKTALMSTALDIAAAGVDRDSGYGIVMPYAALQSVGATGKAFLEFSSLSVVDINGNSNGIVEPGEDGQFTITLKNTGRASASAISATLTTSTSGITVKQATSAYATLAAGAAGANSSSLAFHVAGNPLHLDQTINFTLTVTYVGGWNAQQTFPISFRLGGTRRSISTIFDATAPATSTAFPSTNVGVQTSTLYLDNSEGSCASPKDNPGANDNGTHQFESYTLTNMTGAPACATVTVTFDKSATDLFEVAVYQGTYHGSSLALDTYLGDAAYPYATVTRSFPVLVPTNASITIVVNEYSSYGTGTGTPYTLEVTGLGDDRIFFDEFD